MDLQCSVSGVQHNDSVILTPVSLLSSIVFLFRLLNNPEQSSLYYNNRSLLAILYRSVCVVVQSLSRVWLCDPMDSSMAGFPAHHQLLEFAQTHVHQVGDAIQSSHPLSSPSHPLSSPSPAFNISQHQGLFQWVSSSVARVLELQLQHPSFQRIFRANFL